MILFLMAYARLLSAVAVCLLLASCALFGPRRPEAPPYTGPVSVEALSNRMAFSGVDGLRAEIRARVYQGDKKVGSFSGSFVFRAPDDMRVVLYNAFGTTVMDIVKAAGSIEAYVPSEDAMYIGPALSLMPSGGTVMRLEQVEEAYRLVASGGQGNLRMYDFDLRSAVHSSSVVISNEGIPAIRAEFYDYNAWESDGAASKIPATVPGGVSIDYGGSLRLMMTLKEPDTSRPVPDRLFPLGRSAAHYYDIRSLGAGRGQ